MLGRSYLQSALVILIGLICTSADGQIPPIPASAQHSIERILGTIGTYSAAESVFKIRLARNDIRLDLLGQRLTNGFPVESWVAFSPEIRGGGLLMSELQLLEQEVDGVSSAALDGELSITGLANAMMLDQPRLLTMNLSGTGSFDKLATGMRKSLDAIAAVHSSKVNPLRPPFPRTSSIDAGPIDAILAMKGSVRNGIYRASIGQIAVLNNTPFGKEMGAGTSVVLAGTNLDALMQGEIVCTGEQLQSVLKALRSRKMSLISIRNHTVGEHPQLVFVRFLGSGRATDLASAVRFILDVQVGNVRPAA
jgi:hypothetical protein